MVYRTPRAAIPCKAAAADSTQQLSETSSKCLRNDGCRCARRCVVCAEGSELAITTGLSCGGIMPRRRICAVIALCASFALCCDRDSGAPNAQAYQTTAEPPSAILDGYTADPHAVVF